MSVGTECKGASATAKIARQRKKIQQRWTAIEDGMNADEIIERVSCLVAVLTVGVQNKVNERNTASAGSLEVTVTRSACGREGKERRCLAGGDE